MVSSAALDRPAISPPSPAGDTCTPPSPPSSPPRRPDSVADTQLGGWVRFRARSPQKYNTGVSLPLLCPPFSPPPPLLSAGSSPRPPNTTTSPTLDSALEWNRAPRQREREVCLIRLFESLHERTPRVPPPPLAPPRPSLLSRADIYRYIY